MLLQACISVCVRLSVSIITQESPVAQFLSMRLMIYWPSFNDEWLNGCMMTLNKNIFWHIFCQASKDTGVLHFWNCTCYVIEPLFAWPPRPMI